MITIDEAIETAHWTKLDAPPEAPPDIELFNGSAEGWTLTAASFSIEDQGFPPGSRGYDGAATSTTKGVVVRLTREQAEKACEKAKNA